MDFIAKLAFTVLLVASALQSRALAQTMGAEPQPRDSKACADTAANAARQNGQENLSNKLAQSNGVICPPDVDPAMKAPTPQTGTMPVLPPPGSPGGNQRVQPK